MKKPIFTLSLRGFVDSTAERVDAILSYFIISEYPQSDLYYKQIASLPYIVKTFGDTPRKLSTEIQNSLTAVFSRYFEGVDIEVDHEYIDKLANDGPYMVTIQIIAIGSDGVKANIASQLEIIDSNFKEIARINNEGI